MNPALLALLLAAPPAAVEIVVPTPKSSLPKLEKLFETASKLDARLHPERAKIATGGFVDPFDPAALVAMGVDVNAPLRLYQPDAGRRILVMAQLADPERFDASRDREGVDVTVVDDAIVLGKTRRWWGIARRKGKTLFGMPSTREVARTRGDAKRFAAKESKDLSGMIARAPSRWKRPRGTKAGRDVYVVLRGVDHVTDATAEVALSANFAEVFARFSLDAMATTAFGRFVADGGAKVLLEDRETKPAASIAARVPREGLTELLPRIGVPSAVAEHMTGVVQVVLEEDGSLVVAAETIGDKRAGQVVEAIEKRYPSARAALVGRVAIITFGASKRAPRKRPMKAGVGAIVDVRPPVFFRALYRRSEAKDALTLDTAELALVRFTYGSIAEIGQRVHAEISRARRGFVANARIVHRE